MSSHSCSSEAVRRAGARLLCLAAALLACGHARPPPPAPERADRVAVFPVQNLTGKRAPVKALTAALRASLEARGFELVGTAEVDAALAPGRIRHTAGLDRDAAAALRAARVDAVLVSSVDLHDSDGLPRIALAARLVSTAERPRILWMDRVALAGEDAPGPLGVGLVKSLPELERRAVAQLLDTLEPGAARARCRAGRRFGPRQVFRSPLLDEPDRQVLAVLPFVNASSRRDAGDLVALELARQLVATGAFEVVEPGEVRRALLDFRIILQGGASHDAARTVVDRVGADLVVSGTVLEYEDPAARPAAPQVHYEVDVLDARSGEVVWASRSFARGDDAVWAFGLGRVPTAPALSCRMAEGVASGMAGHRRKLATATATLAQAPLRRLLPARGAR